MEKIQLKPFGHRMSKTQMKEIRNFQLKKRCKVKSFAPIVVGLALSMEIRRHSKTTIISLPLKLKPCYLFVECPCSQAGILQSHRWSVGKWLIANPQQKYSITPAKYSLTFAIGAERRTSLPQCPKISRKTIEKFTPCVLPVRTIERNSTLGYP